MSLRRISKSLLLHRKKLLRRQSALLEFIRFLLSSLSTMSSAAIQTCANKKGMQQTFNCSLCSLATSIISWTYSPKPNCSNAFVICSHAIVFLLSFSLISFASDDIKVMNSTQHSIRRSRASLPNARPELDGRISVTIFWTVAREDVSLWFVSIFEVIDESQRRSPGIAHRSVDRGPAANRSR
jgi:hypothetical protein